MARFVALLAALGLLFSCSGGGGSGGGAAPDVSAGPVTGFGSFFATGIEWTLDPAGVVVLDGVESSDESDIAFGMIVNVEGDRATAVASRVEWDDVVEGPVDTSIASATDTYFTIFGQHFVADESTVYVGTTFDDFQADVVNEPVVEISGMDDQHDVYGAVTRVTRLEQKIASVSPMDPVELEGIASNIVGGGTPSFDVGSVTVTLNDIITCLGIGLTDQSGVGGAVEDGEAVEVKGRYVNATTVCAAVVESPISIPASSTFEAEGFVTSVVSDTDFSVSGLDIDATGATFTPATLSVETGMRLDVEGSLSGTTVTATAVSLRSEVELQALAATATSTEFEVLGHSVKIVIGETEVAGDTLAADKFVDVRAIEDGVGGLTATKVEVAAMAAADRVRIGGRVEAVDAGLQELTIGGVTITADGGTLCLDESAAVIDCTADFFASVVPGDRVEATDLSATFDAFDIADELRFE
jgi:hypothetical protein